MAITAQMVKELREITGAGMMDCKGALDHTNGDLQAAIDYLREKGIAKAAKKAGRIAIAGRSCEPVCVSSPARLATPIAERGSRPIKSLCLCPGFIPAGLAALGRE